MDRIGRFERSDLGSSPSESIYIYKILFVRVTVQNSTMLKYLFSFYKTTEPWQLDFQDPATPIMEGIINLHNDIMFFLQLFYNSYASLTFNDLLPHTVFNFGASTVNTIVTMIAIIFFVLTFLFFFVEQFFDILEEANKKKASSSVADAVKKNNPLKLASLLYLWVIYALIPFIIWLTYDPFSLQKTYFFFTYKIYGFTPVFLLAFSFTLLSINVVLYSVLNGSFLRAGIACSYKKLNIFSFAVVSLSVVLFLQLFVNFPTEKVLGSYYDYNLVSWPKFYLILIVLNITNFLLAIFLLGVCCNQLNSNKANSYVILKSGVGFLFLGFLVGYSYFILNYFYFLPWAVKVLKLHRLVALAALALEKEKQSYWFNWESLEGLKDFIIQNLLVDGLAHALTTVMSKYAQGVFESLGLSIYDYFFGPKKEEPEKDFDPSDLL
jgi:hypothetical protein